MKKILFVINTLGRAGAETALLELLRRLDAEEYEISLYVLLGQGEMISQVPQRVHVKNKKICTASVLSGAGRRKLIQTSFLAFFRHGRTIKKMQYVIQNFFRMKKTGNIQPDKLLWRVWDIQTNSCITYHKRLLIIVQIVSSEKPTIFHSQMYMISVQRSNLLRSGKLS